MFLLFLNRFDLLKFLLLVDLNQISIPSPNVIEPMPRGVSALGGSVQLLPVAWICRTGSEPRGVFHPLLLGPTPVG